jgi:hypothetical protein
MINQYTIGLIARCWFCSKQKKEEKRQQMHIQTLKRKGLQVCKIPAAPNPAPYH